MCQEIHTKSEVIDTAIKFIHFIESRTQAGNVDIFFQNPADSFTFDTCLCPFNIRKTLESNGILFTEIEGMMEFNIIEDNSYLNPI